MSDNGIGGTDMVVIQSRLHDADLTGYVMQDAGGFVYLNLPMTYEPIATPAHPIGVTWATPEGVDDAEI